MLWMWALANEPPIILADEPTDSLDLHASEQVFLLLHDLPASMARPSSR